MKTRASGNADRRRLSSIETFENFTGFGLYDRRVIEIIKSFEDPYPYFRGMVGEIGLPHATIAFNQPRRKLHVALDLLLGLAVGQRQEKQVAGLEGGLADEHPAEDEQPPQRRAPERRDPRRKLPGR